MMHGPIHIKFTKRFFGTDEGLLMFYLVTYALFLKLPILPRLRNFMFPSHESINYPTWHLNKKWWVGGKRMASIYRAFIKSCNFDGKKNKAPFALLNIHILQKEFSQELNGKMRMCLLLIIMSIYIRSFAKRLTEQLHAFTEILI